MPRSSHPRRPRRALVDPRLLVGVALVAASVAGVVGLVATLDRTVEAYTASDVLTPGDRLDEDELTATAVRLGELDGRYLLVGEADIDGMLVTRAVQEGELVPVAALSAAEHAESAPVMIDVSGDLPQDVTPGGSVDLWATAMTDGEVAEPPAVLVGNATVARVVSDEGMIAASGGSVAVELLVPRDDVARVLAARAAESVLSLVPLGRALESAS